MKSIKFLAAVALVATLWACEDKPHLDETPVISNAFVSDCHSHTDKLAAKDMSPDSVVVSWPDDNSPMQVTHYNMMLDCGGANITTTIERTGDVVTVIEHVGEQGLTNCICFYDSSFQINSLPPRPFTLVIKIESLICGIPSQATVYQQAF